MSDSNDELMMETMYWWGIPTLFRCEHNKDLDQCDIALAGVPHSTGNGTTERDQHLGPRAVRHVSAGLRRVHLDFNINPWKKKKIFDLGDVALPHANNNERRRAICQYSLPISCFCISVFSLVVVLEIMFVLEMLFLEMYSFNSSDVSDNVIPSEVL